MNPAQNIIKMVMIILSWFRMTEVDENLNYMLGQLSLVVTEFNQVTTNPTNPLPALKKISFRLKPD